MSDNRITIGGRTYSFGTLPATKAIKVEVAVVKAIGEPLFKAFMSAKKTGSTEKDVEQAGVTAMTLLATRLDADEIITTMNTVFEFCSCDGQRIEIDSTFTGRNKEMWQVFIAALRFNFSDFLPDALFASAASAVGTKLKS